MSVGVLEIQRARRALERFCAARNAAVENAGRFLCCKQLGQDLVLEEQYRPEVAGEAALSRALVRLAYRDGAWLLFWCTGDDAWEPYPHLPRSDSVRRIIDELEQAPLHVHWG